MEQYRLIAVIYMLLEAVSATCQEGCICESGICVRCKDRYSFNSTGCVKCSPRCLRCSEAGKCIECEQAYGLQRGGCRPCGDGCANCTFDSDYVCFDCFEERALQYNLCYRCPAHCEKCSFRETCDVCFDGYYKHNSTSLCSLCPRDCKSCESSEKCLICQAGFYGRLCEDKCSSGCLTNSCNIDTGYCQCKAGFYGQKCDHGSSSGCESPCGDDCLNGSCVMDTDQSTHGGVSSTGPYSLQENNGFPLKPMLIGTFGGATLCIIAIIIVFRHKRNCQQVRIDNDNENNPKESVSSYSLHHFSTTSDDNECSEVNVSQNTGRRSCHHFECPMTSAFRQHLQPE